MLSESNLITLNTNIRHIATSTSRNVISNYALKEIFSFQKVGWMKQTFTLFTAFNKKSFPYKNSLFTIPEI